MNENIDTNKEIVVYQSKIKLSILLLALVIGILGVLSLAWIGYKNGRADLVSSLGLLAFETFFIYLFFSTCKQFFIKTPLFKINSKGFFTRKTGDVLWNDVDKIDINTVRSLIPTEALLSGSSMSQVILEFKNGKKVTINPNFIELPGEKPFVRDRGLNVFKLMDAYKKQAVSDKDDNI